MQHADQGSKLKHWPSNSWRIKSGTWNASISRKEEYLGHNVNTSTRLQAITPKSLGKAKRWSLNLVSWESRIKQHPIIMDIKFSEERLLTHEIRAWRCWSSSIIVGDDKDAKEPLRWRSMWSRVPVKRRKEEEKYERERGQREWREVHTTWEGKRRNARCGFLRINVACYVSNRYKRQWESGRK